MLVLLLPATAAFLFVCCLLAGDDYRSAFLRALVLFGSAVALITEGLSSFNLLHQTALSLAWLLACLWIAAVRLPSLAKHRTVALPRISPSLSLMEKLWATGMVITLLPIGLAALLGAPNV